MISLGFDNSYRRLPDRFHAPQPPSRVRAPRLLAFNRSLAEDLGLDPDVVEPLAAELFSGNAVASDAEPIALAYAGHQFGHFVPSLGDGRALLLGEIVDRAGRRRDVQLKGSGPTPFSRRGDGRAALGPVLREYVVSEAMHALGIPTTRSLAAVATGEVVHREEPLAGAVLTRVAASHLRVGTFQYFAARGDVEALSTLLDHAIGRHDPGLAGTEKPALAFLGAVASRQAELVARWLCVGFVHGVMNTDNTAISGETLDYGPCAFLDGYHPGRTFSSIDQGGRYAFANQPTIAQWNLARLAEALLPLVDADQERAVASSVEVLERFPSAFDRAWQAGLRAKLGLSGPEEEGDRALSARLLSAMQASEADWTLVFRHLADAAERASGEASLRELFEDPRPLDGWLADWRERLARDPLSPASRAAAMRRANPAFIPRNHRVEQALRAASAGDLGPFETLCEVLRRPFDDQPRHAELARAPRPEEVVRATFCGT